jgi:hypothetical protein
MAGVGGIAGRLYRGEVSVNFVGRQRIWYTISGCILLAAIILGCPCGWRGGPVPLRGPHRHGAQPDA